MINQITFDGVKAVIAYDSERLPPKDHAAISVAVSALEKSLNCGLLIRYGK